MPHLCQISQRRFLPVQLSFRIPEHVVHRFQIMATTDSDTS